AFWRADGEVQTVFLGNLHVLFVPTLIMLQTWGGRLCCIAHAVPWHNRLGRLPAKIAYRRRRVGNSEEEAGSVGHLLAADGTARDCRFWGGRAGGDMSGTDESEYRKAP